MANRFWDNGNNRSQQQRSRYGQPFGRRDYERDEDRNEDRRRTSGRFESGIDETYGSSGGERDFEDYTSRRDRGEQFGSQRFGMDQDDEFSSELGSNYRGSRYFGSDWQGQGGYGYQPSQYGYGSQGSPFRQRGRMQGGQGQQQSFRGRGPRGYRPSDERLKEMICERLTEDPFIDASEITIEVLTGQVTLEGSVEDRSVKHQVEDLVSDIGGVDEIQNRLRVQSPYGMGRERARQGMQGQGSRMQSGQSAPESERDKSKKSS